MLSEEERIGCLLGMPLLSSLFLLSLFLCSPFHHYTCRRNPMPTHKLVGLTYSEGIMPQLTLRNHSLYLLSNLTFGSHIVMMFWGWKTHAHKETTQRDALCCLYYPCVSSYCNYCLKQWWNLKVASHCVLFSACNLDLLRFKVYLFFISWQNNNWNLLYGITIWDLRLSGELYTLLRWQRKHKAIIFVIWYIKDTSLLDKSSTPHCIPRSG